LTCQRVKWYESEDRRRIEDREMITAKGKRLEWHQGLTVLDVLNTLGYNYPSVLVRINGTIVRRKVWDSTVVPDEADVEVRTIVAGG
jgi:sulfur carrier protein